MLSDKKCDIIIPFEPVQKSISLPVYSLLQTKIPFSVDFLIKKETIYSVFNFSSINLNEKMLKKAKILNSLELYCKKQIIDILDEQACITAYKEEFNEFKAKIQTHRFISLFVTEWNGNPIHLQEIHLLSQLLQFLSENSQILSLIQVSMRPESHDDINNEYFNILNDSNKKKNYYDTELQSEVLSTDFEIYFSFNITLISLSQKNNLEPILTSIQDYLNNAGFKVRKFPSFFIQPKQVLNIISVRNNEIYASINSNSILNSFLHIQTDLPFWSSLKKLPGILSEGLKLPEHENSIFLGFQYNSKSIPKDKLYVPLSCFSSHLNIWGMTGEGKSRILYGIISQLINLGKKVLIIDLKGEYKYALGLNSDIIYIKPGSELFPLALNIFNLPCNEEGSSEENVENHIEFLTTTFLRVIGEYDMSPQMYYLLQKAIDLTVRKKGNFELFVEIITNPKKFGINKNKISLSSQALLNRTRKLMTGLLKNIFFVEKSNIDINILPKKNLILDLEMFESVENDQARKFFLEIFLNYYFSKIRENNIPVRKKHDLTNFVIFDEAQKIIPEKKRKEYSDEQSIIGKAVWTLRAYGVSMIFSGTEPSIEESVKMNSGLTIAFFTKFNALSMANLLGIQLNHYLAIREHVEHRTFLLSYKGKLGLINSPDYFVNDFTAINLEEQSKDDIQTKMRTEYRKI